MPSDTVEDYVKAIDALQRDSAAGEASVARLASALGVTKGTVTAMVRRLVSAKLARAKRYGGVTLTPKGRRLALDVIRRHRLIEVFLVNVLGFDWAEVHDEAERLEHAMSGKFIDRLDAFLGRPTLDPHGDPIPDALGKLRESRGVPVSEMPEGSRGTITRVLHQDPEFLSLLSSRGLVPGATFVVEDRSTQAGSMSLRAGRRRPLAIGLDTASRLIARRLDAARRA